MRAGGIVDRLARALHDKSGGGSWHIGQAAVPSANITQGKM
jgi:hypothetical protein